MVLLNEEEMNLMDRSEGRNRILKHGLGRFFGIGAALLMFAGLGISYAPLAAAKHLQVVTIGDEPAAQVDYAAFWVAREMGYFADEGIKVDEKTYANGPAGMLDFANGSLDFELAAITPFMEYVAHGGNLKILMSVTKYNAALVGPKKYHSYAQLNGKRIGDPGLGTIHDAVLSYIEQTQHLHFQRVFAKVTDAAVMMEKGEVNAFIAWEPAAALAIKQDPKLHYIVQRPPIKNMESLEIVAQPSLVKKDPEVCYHVVRAILRGMQYIKTHPKTDTAKLIAKTMGGQKAIPVILHAMGSVLVTNPKVDLPSTGILLRTIAKQGKIPEHFVKDTNAWVGQYLDYSFLDRAEKSLSYK